MKFSFRGAGAVRTLGTGLLMQALLSGANFAVGLILIRRTSDLQYSYYILATNALLLLTALQTSFIQPYIVSNLTTLDAAGRHDLVGALLRTNRHTVPTVCAMAFAVTLGIWAFGGLGTEIALLVSVALIAGSMALTRELFRTTLFAYRRPTAVLPADLAFVAVLVSGAFLATLGEHTASAAVASIALAQLIGFLILRKALWRYEPWNTRITDNVLGKIAAAGAWAILGSGIHWLLIQGYSYLVAGVLDIRDIAAIAATRLTLMPVFVLSGGVSMLLYPMTSRWVHDVGPRGATKRLLILVAALGLAALLYMTIMWLLRGWIFAVVLKKSFPHRDSLLLLWSSVFLVTLCRDQLGTLPAARARFRDMTLMTGFSAVIWLLSSYLAMKSYGPPGAVLGILIGEVVNMAGILFMIFRETRHPKAAAPAV
jgi:O-antigen/teichoic acid export membrane protein